MTHKGHGRAKILACLSCILALTAAMAADVDAERSACTVDLAEGNEGLTFFGAHEDQSLPMHSSGDGWRTIATGDLNGDGVRDLGFGSASYEFGRWD